MFRLKIARIILIIFIVVFSCSCGRDGPSVADDEHSIENSTATADTSDSGHTNPVKVNDPDDWVFVSEQSQFGIIYGIGGMKKEPEGDIVIPGIWTNGERISFVRGFSSKGGIRSVVISDGIINVSGFDECNSLETVSLPGSVRVISSNAFKDCKNLHSVNFPEGLEIIENDAFYGCDQLAEKICFPSTLKEIGRSAFRRSGVTGISFSEMSSPKIMSEAFRECRRLRSLILPCGTLSEEVFRDCTALEEVILPDNLITIPPCCFYGCSALKEIIISEVVKSIGFSAFVRCESLKNVEIPPSVTSIGDGAFDFCSSLEKVIIKGVPRTVWFVGCNKLKRVDIPDGVERVYFKDCESLESLLIPVTVDDGLHDLDLFSGCPALRTIEVAEGNRRYRSEKNCVFDVYTGALVKGCAGSTIPGGTETIEWGAFYGTTGLENIYIPGSVSNIGEFAFTGCTDLKKITIGHGITALGAHMFENCTALKTVEFTASVSHIGIRAFFGCSSLETINFTGTKNQWQGITFSEEWNYEMGKYTVICSDGMIEF